MSASRDWEVEETPRNFKIEIEDAHYTVSDEGLAAIAHAILLLQDTLKIECEQDRNFHEDIYKDSKDRFQVLNEKRISLENSIEEMFEKTHQKNNWQDAWENAKKSIPIIDLIVKLEDGNEYLCSYERGKFMSPVGIEYANVISWRYADASQN